jgi:hypothetical protein
MVLATQFLIMAGMINKSFAANIHNIDVYTWSRLFPSATELSDSQVDEEGAQVQLALEPVLNWAATLLCLCTFPMYMMILISSRHALHELTYQRLMLRTMWKARFAKHPPHHKGSHAKAPWRTPVWVLLFWSLLHAGQVTLILPMSIFISSVEIATHAHLDFTTILTLGLSMQFIFSIEEWLLQMLVWEHARVHAEVDLQPKRASEWRELWISPRVLRIAAQLPRQIAVLLVAWMLLVIVIIQSFATDVTLLWVIPPMGLTLMALFAYQSDPAQPLCSVRQRLEHARTSLWAAYVCMQALFIGLFYKYLFATADSPYSSQLGNSSRPWTIF